MKLTISDEWYKDKEHIMFTSVDGVQIKSKIEIIDDNVVFDVENMDDVKNLTAIKTIKQYKSVKKEVKKDNTEDDMFKVIDETKNDLKKVLNKKKKKELKK